MEYAGTAWCDRFPASNRLEDLEPAFGASVRAFTTAIEIAGGRVAIADTFRPAERAYLMHFACLVAGYRDDQKVFHQISPGDVPAMAGVEIDWTCGGDGGAARTAAVAMRKRFDIVYPAALVSNHTRRKAVDMRINFQGVIHVRTRSGTLVPVERQQDLWPVGKSYGVIKLASDEPHWSVDGH